MTTTHLQVVDDGGTAIEDLFTGDLFNAQKKLHASITAGSCVGEVQLLGTADGKRRGKRTDYGTENTEFLKDASGEPALFLGHLVMHHRSTDPQIERPGRGRILNISIDTPESGFASVLSDHENNNLYIFSFKKKRFSAKFIRLPRGLSARSQCWIPDIGTKGEPVRTLLIGTNAGSLFAYSVDVSRGEAERLQLISTAASKKPIYGIVAGKVEDGVLVTFAAENTMYHQVCSRSSLAEGVENWNEFTTADTIAADGLVIEPQLHLHGPTSKGFVPWYFMWTSCEKQIVVGDIDVLTSPEVECGANSVIRRSGAADTVTKRSILDCVLTPYHLLLLTRVEIIAVKRLTLSVEFEKDFSPFLSRAGHRIDELVAFTRDALSGSLWVVTKHGGLLMVEVSKDNANVVQDALEAKRFDVALALSENKKVILEQEADHFFETGDYSRAAKLYAKAEKSIRIVLLKLARKCGDDTDLLRSLQTDFLVPRLDTVPHSEASQRSIICLLLVEIYSARISLLSAESKEFLLLQREFHQFIETNFSDMPATSGMEVMASHGRYEEASILASYHRNYKAAVEVHLRVGNYQQAFQVVEGFCTSGYLASEQRAQVLEYASPYLASCQPMRLARLWKTEDLNEQIDPSVLTGSLLQSLRKAAPDARKELLRALRWFLEGMLAERRRSETVERGKDFWWRLLIRVYVEIGDEEAACKLVAEEKSLSNLSLGIALLEVWRVGFLKLSVQIYGLLGLHSEAVEIALRSGDIPLAEQHASKVSRNTGISNMEAKELWKRIASYDGADLISVVDRSEGCIRIEDVLSLTDAIDRDQVSDEVRLALKESLRFHVSRAAKAKAATEDLLLASDKIGQRIGNLQRAKSSGVGKSGTRGDIEIFSCGHSFLRGLTKGNCLACGEDMIKSVSESLPSTDFDPPPAG